MEKYREHLNKKFPRERVDVKQTRFCSNWALTALPLAENHFPSITVSAIFTTQFSALTKNIIISKHHQLDPLVDDDSTP